MTTTDCTVVVAQLRAIDDSSIGVGRTREAALDDAIAHNEKSRTQIARLLKTGDATVDYEERRLT
jgi:hypothetical protein